MFSSFLDHVTSSGHEWTTLFLRGRKKQATFSICLVSANHTTAPTSVRRIIITAVQLTTTRCWCMVRKRASLVTWYYHFPLLNYNTVNICACQSLKAFTWNLFPHHSELQNNSINTYTFFAVREQRGFFAATEVVYCGFGCDKLILCSHHGVFFKSSPSCPGLPLVAVQYTASFSCVCRPAGCVMYFERVQEMRSPEVYLPSFSFFLFFRMVMTAIKYAR